MKRALCLLLTLCLVMGLTPALAEGKYTPGTYEASAAGFGGDIKIAVEVSEDAILGVSVLEHSETEGVGTINFFANGFVERSVIIVGDELARDGEDGATYYSISLNPLTGQSSVTAGYMEISSTFFEEEEDR